MAVANALQNDVVSSPVANVATPEDLATRQVNVANVITQVRVITAPPWQLHIYPRDGGS